MDNSSFAKNKNIRVKTRYCWFCQRECRTFVSICSLCKIDRKLVKIDKNISLKT